MLAVIAIPVALHLVWGSRAQLGSQEVQPYVYLRVFKLERELEIWAGTTPREPYRLLATHPVLAASGGPGPKRREGDRQVPEGFYKVDRFNPKSKYHLSLGIDYPNASDRVRSDKTKPGGDIFIHGSSVSIGCVAIGNKPIELVYGYCESSRKKFGRAARVDIYPFRMTDKNWAEQTRVNPGLKAFWTEIRPGFQQFEQTRLPAPFTIGRSGNYLVTKLTQPR